MAKPSLFSIDDDLTDQGYEGVAAQVLNFKLRSTVGVRSAQLQVWDANAFNPELGDILENPPRSSPSAPALTLSNGTATGQAVDFSPLSGEITCTLPSGVTASWLVRCVINGGQRVMNGVVVRDPNLIHERMVVIRSGAGLRQLVATETRQQSDHGVAQWAEEVLAALGSVATSSAGDWKPSVRVATTASLPAYNRVGNVITGTANGTVPSATTDSTATQAGDRVLLLHGAAPEDNGIYDVSQAGVAGGGGSPFIWTRAEDADSSAKVTPGMRVPVEEGTINAAKVFKLTTTGAIVLNTTGLSFSRENDLPNGTTVDQIAKWDGSGWLAGALNLAAAAAVTGILGLANGGTGLSATPAANTVLTGTGAAAAWSDAPTVASLSATSYLAVGAGTKATAGDIRFDSSWSIQQRNAEPGTIDRNVLSGTGESYTLGDSAQTGQAFLWGNYLNLLGQGGVYAKATNFFIQTAAGQPCFEFGPNTATMTITATTLAPVISQSDHATTGHTFTIQAQNVTTGTGSTLLLKAGTGSIANGLVQIGYGATVTGQFGASLSYAKVGANFLWQGDGTNLALYNGAGTQVAALYATASDYLKLGATPATAGHLRLGHAVSAQGRNNTNSGDIRVWDHGVTVANCATFGSEDNVQTYLRANSFLTFIVNSANSLQIGATQFYCTIPDFRFAPGVAAPRFMQDDKGDNSAPQDLLISAQGAWASATGANRDGGDLLLKAGTTTSGGAASRVRMWSGYTGGGIAEIFNFYYDSPTSLAVLTTISGAILIQPPASASTYIRAGVTSGDIVLDTMQTTGSARIRTGSGGDPVFLAINKNAAFFTATGSYGGGVGVVFVADRTTAPTTTPSGGGIFFSESGKQMWRDSSGTTHQVTP